MDTDTEHTHIESVHINSLDYTSHDPLHNPEQTLPHFLSSEF